jgi:hypothetical protein
LKQTFRHQWSGEALGYNKWIVAECLKEFAQHLGLLGVPGHAIHLSLQLLNSDRPLPVILQHL